MTNLENLFISKWESPEIFSDLTGNKSVHETRGMLEGWNNRMNAFEAQVGEKNLVDASLFTLLARYKNCVCKLSCEGTDFNGRNGSWCGTGFLVGRNLLLTNNHVLHNATAANNAIVDFEFERSPDQLRQNIINFALNKRTFKLEPSRLFITSPAVGGLDFTLVWITEEASETYGSIPMSRGSFIPSIYEPVFIIHHPNGGLKQASVDDTELLNVNATTILYAADTEAGSSGAPVFNRQGRLIGLHHAYSNNEKLLKNHPGRAKKLQDGNSYNIANEGIKLSAIAIFLEKMLGDFGSDAAMVKEALDHFKDNDSLTGPFGALGRSVETFSDNASAKTVLRRDDPSRVVELYNSTDQDLDIATWDVEWLNDHFEDSVQMERAATVVADLTMDIWVLNGISPEAAKTLKTTLYRFFKQDYKIVFTTQSPEYSRPSTAIMFNPKTARVERDEWSPEIDRVLRTDAEKDLGLSTLYGPVFPRYPARFSLGLATEDTPFKLIMVPLHVGETGNAALRKVLAARLLTKLVDTLALNPNSGQDWLILGDTNTPFKTTRLQTIEKVGFTPLTVIDQHNGGFSYLRNPGSVLSHIFVPTEIKSVSDETGLVTVAKGALPSKYAEAVSDNAPLVFRLSVYDRGTAADICKAQGNLSFESGTVGSGWVWQGLTKREFMISNEDRFKSLLNNVNADSSSHYGSEALGLTLLDLWVIIYCEAGIKNGHINPHAVHSLDEVGLLPLPENIKFWNGPDAPAFDQPMPLATNLEQYARYLCQLKNKAVKNSNHGMMYRDFFRIPTIAISAVTQAKLLAGVVHGYFYSGVYKNGASPNIAKILTDYGNDLPITQILAGSNYVHEGTSILPNRQANIDAAVLGYKQSQTGLY